MQTAFFEGRHGAPWYTEGRWVPTYEERRTVLEYMPMECVESTASCPAGGCCPSEYDCTPSASTSPQEVRNHFRDCASTRRPVVAHSPRSPRSLSEQYMRPQSTHSSRSVAPRARRLQVCSSYYAPCFQSRSSQTFSQNLRNFAFVWQPSDSCYFSPITITPPVMWHAYAPSARRGRLSPHKAPFF